jgi:hypothetical protein
VSWFIREFVVGVIYWLIRELVVVSYIDPFVSLSWVSFLVHS